MVKQGGMVLHLLKWITGVIVSLAVAFGMTSGVLTVPYLTAITPIIGWIVVVTTLLSVILAIAKN